MHEVQVSGELQSIAWRDGSSGRFSGDIEGLYQGYRGNPPEQEGVMLVAHGSLALVLRHESRVPFPDRPAEHPFAGGKTIQDLMPPEGAPGPAGQGTQAGAASGPFQGRERTRITLSIDPERSTGIFAGASGELTVEAPRHKEPGYLTVSTERGDLHLSFLEWGEEGKLVADLWVDGEKSTGVYHNARGSLKFALTRIPGRLGKGPYSGTIELQDLPADG